MVLYLDVKPVFRREGIGLLELISVLALASRTKAYYDYTQVKSFDDICLITARSFLTECLIYQAKQNLRNQYLYW